MLCSLSRKGLDISAANEISGMKEEAGFVDVRVGVIQVYLELGSGRLEGSRIGRYSVDISREDQGRMKTKL